MNEKSMNSTDHIQHEMKCPANVQKQVSHFTLTSFTISPVCEN